MFSQFQDLAEDNTSGATELIRRLVALCESCTFGFHVEAIRQGLSLLEHSQKSMPSLHAVIQILKADFLPKLSEGGENTEAIAYLDSLQKILDESGAAIADQFINRCKSEFRVLTLSRSSTVLTCLKRLHDAGRLAHLYVLESRPMNEGVRTIRDCAEYGIPSTLLVDAALMEVLPQVQCVVTGADSVTADGFLLNKVGTYPLAVCAHTLGVPMYVLCDSLKFSPLLRAGIEVEDSPATEVITPKEGAHFDVWNRYFEWVPVDFVTAFITEQGFFPPDQLVGLASE